MSRLTHVLYGAAAALLVIAAPAISHADSATAQQTRSMSVRYDDLTLDHPAGVKTLYHRITVAADKVCGPRELTGSHLALPSYQYCYDAAVSGAVTAVASPALSAYYQSLPSYPGTHAPALARR
jgi:UrcA family protein